MEPEPEEAGSEVVYEEDNDKSAVKSGSTVNGKIIIHAILITDNIYTYLVTQFSALRFIRCVQSTTIDYLPKETIKQFKVFKCVKA